MDTVNLNLITVIGETDFLTKWLGISIEHKLSGSLRFRRTLLLLVLHLGLLHALLISFVPTSEEKTLLLYGDIGFHMLGQYRYFLFWIDFFFRLNPALMITYFYFDNLEWLQEAGKIIDGLQELQVNRSIRRHIRRSKLMIIVSWMVVGASPMTCQLASMYGFRERNSRYGSLLFSHLYISLFGFLDVLISCKFIIQLYLVCKVASDVFHQVNALKARQLTLYRSRLHFSHYHCLFWQLSVFVHHLRSYLRAYYIIYLVCFFPVSVPFLYVSIFNDQVHPAIRLVFLLLMCYLAYLLLFLSNLIGQIDASSRKMADLVYENFVLKSSLTNSKHTEKLVKYFGHVWGNSGCVEIMGQPINSKTSVTILTAFLTILAFLVGNLKD